MKLDLLLVLEPVRPAGDSFTAGRFICGLLLGVLLGRVLLLGLVVFTHVRRHLICRRRTVSAIDAIVTHFAALKTVLTVCATLVVVNIGKSG